MTLIPRFALVVVAVLATAMRAEAHDGPPYPIFVDEPVGAWTLSVWADPDVGEGTFYVYVGAPEGSDPASIRVLVESEGPVDTDTPATQTSGRSELADEGEEYDQIVLVPYDRQGRWPTRIRVVDQDGESLGELRYDLEVTPPGLGAIYLVFYAIPFLLAAAVWIRGLVAQRAYERGGPD